MGLTKIEWARYTFNPWIGCQRVSPACEHCYAEAFAKRTGAAEWGPKVERVITSAANWRTPLKWNTQARVEVETTGKRPIVFCSSLADVFEDRPELDLPRLWLFELIRQTPHLMWLLLTKRPEKIGELLARAGRLPHGDDDTLIWLSQWLAGVDVPGHVGIGTTVETQEWAEKRVPHLLQVPAAVHFLSVEPLLGPVDIERYLRRMVVRPAEALTERMIDAGWSHPYGDGDHPPLDWVIVGGESGHGARPMHPQWVQALRDQCVATDVPYFFKQWGEWLPGCTQEETLKSQPVHVVFPDGERADFSWDTGYPNGAYIVRRVGKKAAGALLDGVAWKQMPEGTMV